MSKIIKWGLIIPCILATKIVPSHRDKVVFTGDIRTSQDSPT